MKHLPKVLLPVAILLFVFSTAKAEPTLDEAVPVGIGASGCYILGGGEAVVGCALIAVFTDNEIPDGYMQSEVRYKSRTSNQHHTTSAVDYCANQGSYAGRTVGSLPSCS